jgi:hypothetical protein
MLTATGDASPVPNIFFCIDVCSRYAVWRFITLIIVFYIARSCTTTYENTSRLPYVSRGAVRRSAAHAPTRTARGTDGVLRDSGACSLGRGRRARLSLVQHAAVRACVQLRDARAPTPTATQISDKHDKRYILYILFIHVGSGTRAPRGYGSPPPPRLWSTRAGRSLRTATRVRNPFAE